MKAGFEQAVRDTATLLEERGWVQWATISNRGVCLAAAIILAVPDDLHKEVWQRVLELAGSTSITTWNDAPGRTLEDVLELLRRAGDPSC